MTLGSPKAISQPESLIQPSLETWSILWRTRAGISLWIILFTSSPHRTTQKGWWSDWFTTNFSNGSKPRGHREDTEYLAWGRTWASADPLSESKGRSVGPVWGVGHGRGQRVVGWEQGWREVPCCVGLVESLRQGDDNDLDEARSPYLP